MAEQNIETLNEVSAKLTDVHTVGKVELRSFLQSRF